MDTRFAINNIVQNKYNPSIIFTITEIMIDDTGIYYTGYNQENDEVAFYRQDFLELYE